MAESFAQITRQLRAPDYSSSSSTTRFGGRDALRREATGDFDGLGVVGGFSISSSSLSVKRSL